MASGCAGSADLCVDKYRSKNSAMVYSPGCFSSDENWLSCIQREKQFILSSRWGTSCSSLEMDNKSWRVGAVIERNSMKNEINILLE